MGKYGIRPPSIDRDSFLTILSAEYGAQAWIECDAKTRNLQNVVVCVLPVAPYNVTDCPWSPSKENGAECAGELFLPVATSVPPAVRTPLCFMYIFF